jgi:hypothetical protein
MPSLGQAPWIAPSLLPIRNLRLYIVPKSESNHDDCRCLVKNVKQLDSLSLNWTIQTDEAHLGVASDLILKASRITEDGASGVLRPSWLEIRNFDLAVSASSIFEYVSFAELSRLDMLGIADVSPFLEALATLYSYFPSRLTHLELMLAEHDDGEVDAALPSLEYPLRSLSPLLDLSLDTDSN